MAAPKAAPKGSAPGKGKSKKKNHKNENMQRQYPIVTSSICEVCTTQCAVGIAYMKRMHIDGAKGTGIVCKKADFS